jgi:hypothetical protein
MTGRGNEQPGKEDQEGRSPARLLGENHRMISSYLT